MSDDEADRRALVESAVLAGDEAELAVRKHMLRAAMRDVLAWIGPMPTVAARRLCETLHRTIVETHSDDLECAEALGVLLNLTVAAQAECKGVQVLDKLGVGAIDL